MATNIKGFEMQEAWKAVFKGLGVSFASSQVEDVDLGFNAFSLMSDIYHRENFFSDVIKEILNPSAKHGQGEKFLRLFVEYLVTVCSAKISEGLDGGGRYDSIRKRLKEVVLRSDLSNAVLSREEDKIDVKICHPLWTILIENKINNACDMDRQIPRYVEKCRDKKENVVAVVYLKPNDGDAFPCGLDSLGDQELVRDVLIPVAGYRPGAAVPDLVSGWLDRCELAAGQFDAKCVIGQFGKLIVKQAGEVMEMNRMDEAYKSFCQNVTYGALKDFVEKLPGYMATRIVESFKSNMTRFQNPYVWNASSRAGEVAVLDGFVPSSRLSQNIRLAIDISCTPVWRENRYFVTIAFFARENAAGFSIRDYAADFRDLGFVLDERDSRLRMYKPADEVFANIGQFIIDLGGLVEKIEAREGVFAPSPSASE